MILIIEFMFLRLVGWDGLKTVKRLVLLALIQELEALQIKIIKKGLVFA